MARASLDRQEVLTTKFPEVMTMNQLSRRATMGSLLAASLLSFGCGDDVQEFPFNPIAPAPPLAVNDSYSVSAKPAS